MPKESGTSNSSSKPQKELGTHVGTSRDMESTSKKATKRQTTPKKGSPKKKFSPKKMTANKSSKTSHHSTIKRKRDTPEKQPRTDSGKCEHVDQLQMQSKQYL